MLRSFKVIDVGTPESSSAVLVVIRSKSVSICSGSHARRANSDFLVGVPLFGAVVQQKYPRTQRMWQTTDRPRHGEMCSYRWNGLRCKKRLRVKRKRLERHARQWDQVECVSGVTSLHHVVVATSAGNTLTSDPGSYQPQSLEPGPPALILIFSFVLDNKKSELMLMRRATASV